MMITDPFIAAHIQVSSAGRYAVEAFFALAVIVAGRVLQGRPAESAR
jgi:hypothetical protein